MKKLFNLSILLFFALISLTFAQQNKQEVPVFKPTFIVSDVYIALTILENVDVKGNEVEAFIEVKNTLNSYLELAKNNNLKVSEKMTVSMPGNIAQNTITFLGRATLKGNMAESYKRFIDAIIQSATPKK